MLLLSSYTFLDVMATMLVFFFWVLWLWLLFVVFADIFRRQDLSGWGKGGWLFFVIILPYLGTFVYLISQHDGMTSRTLEQQKAQKQQFDSYVRETAGSGGGGNAADQIAQAKSLLDSGAITQEEFDKLKAQALA